MEKAVLDVWKTQRGYPRGYTDGFLPIQFTLCNDEYPFLTTFVRAYNGNLSYFSLLTEKNKEIMHNNNIVNYSSHSSLKMQNGFFNFLFLQPDKPHDIFRYIDEYNLKCYVYSASEVFGGDYKYISETSGYNDMKSGHFLIGIGKDIDYYEIYSCSEDLRERNFVCSVGGHRYPPHHVLSWGRMLFATEFFEQRVKMPDGEIAYDYIDLKKCIYGRGDILSKMANRLEPHNVLKTNMFKVEPLPGELFLYDMITGESEFVKTGFTPSHIEFLDDIIYVSSHNFLFLKGTMVYLGPASINAYKIVGTRLQYLNTFKHPTGYRFTAHKAFYREGKRLLLTIGHPNRLFLIDGDTMELIEYIDLGERSVLSSCGDIKEYLNNMDMLDHYNPLRFSTVEVSQNGKKLMYWDQRYLKVMDIPFNEPTNVIDFREEGLKQKTYHSERM